MDHRSPLRINNDKALFLIMKSKVYFWILEKRNGDGYNWLLPISLKLTKVNLTTTWYFYRVNVRIVVVAVITCWFSKNKCLQSSYSKQFPSVNTTRQTYFSHTEYDFNSRKLVDITYPDVLSIYEHLWHKDLIASHALLDLSLEFVAHEHVPFFELHKQRPQDLLDLHACLVGVAQNTHRGRVDDDLAGFLFLVVLETKACNG